MATPRAEYTPRTRALVLPEVVALVPVFQGSQADRAARVAIEVGAKRAAVDRAERATWHDLRRTTAQLMLRGGASDESLAAVLGHATTHVTQTVYAQLRGDVLAERLRREFVEDCAIRSGPACLFCPRCPRGGCEDRGNFQSVGGSSGT